MLSRWMAPNGGISEGFGNGKIGLGSYVALDETGCCLHVCIRCICMGMEAPYGVVVYAEIRLTYERKRTHACAWCL